VAGTGPDGAGGHRACGPGVHRLVPARRRRRRARAPARRHERDGGRERHLTLNRTDDGFWLLDTGSGGRRSDFDGAVDIDLAFSPMFNTLPIRRLGLHRGAGDHLLTMVFVALPELTVEVVQQRYRALSPLGEGERPAEATVAFAWDAFTAELVVDAEAVVVSYPGVASRIPDVASAAP